jgi:hypothetical protein
VNIVGITGDNPNIPVCAKEACSAQTQRRGHPNTMKQTFVSFVKLLNTVLVVYSNIEFMTE